MLRIVVLSNLGDIDFFKAVREQEVSLEDFPGLSINTDNSNENENITLHNVNNLSKLLAQIF